VKINFTTKAWRVLRPRLKTETRTWKFQNCDYGDPYLVTKTKIWEDKDFEGQDKNRESQDQPKTMMST